MSLRDSLINRLVFSYCFKKMFHVVFMLVFLFMEFDWPFVVVCRSAEPSWRDPF